MKFTRKQAMVLGLFLAGMAVIIFWARKRTEGFEDAAPGSPGYKMVMYGVDWCPHCVSAKPEFEKLGAKKTIGGKEVSFVFVNPEKDKAAAEGKKISGFPTFHLYDAQGALLKEYEGPRTKEGIETFLASSL
jgi:thiol-disulfide isomerase/thioredoxin